MEKELRKCYEVLDLPFSATEEDVKSREKALIKIYNNKSLEKGVSFEKQIGLIESSTVTILENLKKNGIPKDVPHSFNSSWSSIGYLAITLVFIALVCCFSFYILL